MSLGLSMWNKLLRCKKKSVEAFSPDIKTVTGSHNV